MFECYFCPHPMTEHRQWLIPEKKQVIRECMASSCICGLDLGINNRTILLSIIIVTFNSLGAIENCLFSLTSLDLSPNIVIETIIIDNNSSDGTRRWLQDNIQGFPRLNIAYLQNSSNLGLSRATNQAFQKAHGDYIIITNPDVSFNAGLQTLIDACAKHYRHDMIGPGFLEPDGSEQRKIHSRKTDLTRLFFTFSFVGSFIDKMLLGKRYMKYYSYSEESLATDQIVDQLGACMMFTRKTVNRLGTIYDERLPIYFGDVDLSIRAEKLGIRSIWLTEVKFKHIGGHSMNSEHVNARRFTFMRDMVRFCKLWGPQDLLVRTLFFLDAIVTFPMKAIMPNNRQWAKWTSLIRLLTEQARGLVLG